MTAEPALSLGGSLVVIQGVIIELSLLRMPGQALKHQQWSEYWAPTYTTMDNHGLQSSAAPLSVSQSKQD